MTESERQKASSEYYSELKKQLDELLKKDTELLKISEKIRNNKANFEDTAKYSEIVSNYIAKVIQDNVGNISSPMGKEYVCKELLNSYYSSINDVLGKVQVSVDSKNNIHIRPQQAPVPTERIEQIAHSLEDTTVSEDVIKRRSGSPVANVAKSFHDDFIQKNATFRNKAGLKCYITRHSSGNCCKWCSSIAGKYLYKDAPHDVFRRHDNCNCTVTYENGKQRQDVWSKRTWQAKETPKEKYKPVKLNYEQAKAIEQKNLQYKGVKNNLTFSDNNVKINDIESRFDIKSKYYSGRIKLFDITNERIEKIPFIETKILTHEQNVELQKYSKELLSYMRNDKVGREGLLALDMNMKKIKKYKGDEQHLSVSVPNDITEQCIIIHNHPSGLIFSPKDLEQFSFHDEICLLGAIGNNGNVYFIEKTENFDPQQFDFIYYQLQNKYGKINDKNEFIPNSNEAIFEFIEEILDRGEECGFNTYIRTNNQFD